MYYVIYRKNSTTYFSLGGECIWNGISIRGNAPFKMNHWQMFINAQEAFLFVHFNEDALLLISISFQIGSPPNENGTGLISIIVL